MIVALLPDASRALHIGRALLTQVHLASILDLCPRRLLNGIKIRSRAAARQDVEQILRS